MVLTPDYLHSVGEVIAAASSLRDAMATWHTHDPDARMVVVDASDMRDEIPVLHLVNRRVYLASSNGHCWHITQQPEQATALILTQD
jgi:hypothetical protein